MVNVSRDKTPSLKACLCVSANAFSSPVKIEKPDTGYGNRVLFMSDPTECPRTNDHDPAMEINKRPTEDIIVDLTL